MGDYKKVANEVGGETTVSPEKVSLEMKKLLAWYNELNEVTIQDIIKFHHDFEKIHPFQDGNGEWDV